ncbi:hypothetical protein VCEC0051_003268A, partial [Vibrio cholerae O1 str. EC-0051]
MSVLNPNPSQRKSLKFQML